MRVHDDCLEKSNVKFNDSGVPYMMKGAYLDTLEEDIERKTGKKFVLTEEQKRLRELLWHLVENRRFLGENEDVRWSVLLLGTVGNGKTTLATATVNYINSFPAFNGIELSYYKTVSGLLQEVKKTYSPDSKLSEGDVISLYSKCRLLVIDELKEKMSDYERSILEQIIVNREINQNPMILIGNMSTSKLKEVFDSHILDRLNAGTIVGFSHSSFRGRN